MKLNQLFLSGLIVLTSLTAFARGGDLVNNGGGIAEKNILYAYEKLDRYISLCLKSDACKLTESQKRILSEILAGLPEERASKQLHFASERKTPGTFIIDGLVRVAKTGSSIGSPIYINSDLLYAKNESGIYDPMSIAEGFAVLIHELGHHYGNYSHDELDLIGVRASLLLQQKFTSAPMIPWTSEISASVFNSDFSKSFPDVLLSIGDDVIDVSGDYFNEVYCAGLTIPIPILPIKDLELLTKKPIGSTLYNLHWESLRERNDILSVAMAGNISNSCVYKNKVNVGLLNNDYKIRITFKIQKNEGKWFFVKGSLKMDQFKDPWWKILRISQDTLSLVK